MRALISVVVALALGMPASGARGAQNWTVDDTCTKSTSGSYFYLGGPLTGWYIHSGSGNINNCHLYNYTTGNANPINWAHYLLPINASYDGFYNVRAYINCHHNEALMKYYIYLYGSGGGVSSIATRDVSAVCAANTTVVSPANYRASMGASIRLVDNVGASSDPQNADTHAFTIP